MEKKVVIGGCRDYNDYVFFKSCLDEILKSKKDEIIIISGHCSGVDLMGERYAAENGFNVEIFFPEWAKYGRAAGPIRNKKMVETADLIIAFWDGTSKGTRSLIKCAQNGKKDVIIIDI
jgi:hypothetical protein